jgi:hypothetical protein
MIKRDNLKMIKIKSERFIDFFVLIIFCFIKKKNLNDIRQLYPILRKSLFSFLRITQTLFILKNPNVLWSTMFLICFKSLNQLGNKLRELYPSGKKLRIEIINSVHGLIFFLIFTFQHFKQNV